MKVDKMITVEEPDMTIKTPSDVLPLVSSFTELEQENFLVLCINSAHCVKSIHICGIGTLNNAIVGVREIYKHAIRENSAAIIVCHNHPSGDTRPSDCDLKATKALLDASSIIGISFLDHIIISRNGYFSFLENGILSDNG